MLVEVLEWYFKELKADSSEMLLTDYLTVLQLRFVSRMDSIESPVMASGAPGAVERHERRGGVSTQAPLVRLGPIPSGRGALCRRTHLLLPQAGQHLQHQPSSGTPPGLSGKNDYRHLQVVGAFHPRPILIRMRSQPGVDH